jgi:hypothetical protein
MQLSIQNQFESTERKTISPEEEAAYNVLKNYDPSSYLLTFSWRSQRLSEMVPFAWRLTHFREHLWEANSPELVLETLFSTGRQTVIYLNDRDYRSIQRPPYNESYLTRHLIQTRTPSYQDKDMRVYQLEPMAAPTDNSSIVLVLPDDTSDNYLTHMISYLSTSLIIPQRLQMILRQLERLKP